MSAEEKKNKKEAPEEKKMEIKNPSVDFPVKVRSLDGDKYHDNGVEFEVGSKKAKQLEARGWVEIIGKVAGMFLLFAMLSFTPEAKAQQSVLSDLKSVYNLTRDTVSNTGTIYLTSGRVAGPGDVTIQVNATKISGTVGGTISLQGSLDGTNFKALNTAETQTALATVTATDASNVYHWRLNGSPFLYYRVSWTGTGTMAASFTAKILKH